MRFEELKGFVFVVFVCSNEINDVWYGRKIATNFLSLVISFFFFHFTGPLRRGSHSRLVDLVSAVGHRKRIMHSNSKDYQIFAFVM